MRKALFFLVLLMTVPVVCARAQFADASTGLLQMPTAEMQQDGTFMITNNFLNKHSLPRSGWNYNTFQYGFAVSFWERIEVGYVCTIFNGAWDPRSEEEKGRYWTIMRNQDRHFTGRVQLLREGDGFDWMPALAFGMCDPTTGSGGGEYATGDVSGVGNGYFNRNFIIFTKHFNTVWGLVGTHVGYQFNRRADFKINAPCAGLDWKPIWLQNNNLLSYMDVILEFDSRTVNMGFIASLWNDRFEAMFELQDFQWINFGLRYKLRVKK